ncbi:phosphate signaling complex PhoU family protein, partial [Staphylococcus epidermidis]
QINHNLIILITTQQPIPTHLPIIIPPLKISTHFEPIPHNPPTIPHIPLTLKINHNYLFTRLKTIARLPMLILQHFNNPIRNKHLPLIKQLIETHQDIHH